MAANANVTAVEVGCEFDSLTLGPSESQATSHSFRVAVHLGGADRLQRLDRSSDRSSDRRVVIGD